MEEMPLQLFEIEMLRDLPFSLYVHVALKRIRKIKLKIKIKGKKKNLLLFTFSWSIFFILPFLLSFSYELGKEVFY